VTEVNRNTLAQAGVTIWIHKSVGNKTFHIHWNKLIIETLRTDSGNLTLIGVYAPE
jgi:hypothetical protein